MFPLEIVSVEGEEEWGMWGWGSYNHRGGVGGRRGRILCTLLARRRAQQELLSPPLKLLRRNPCCFVVQIVRQSVELGGGVGGLGGGGGLPLSEEAKASRLPKSPYLTAEFK